MGDCRMQIAGALLSIGELYQGAKDRRYAEAVKSVVAISSASGFVVEDIHNSIAIFRTSDVVLSSSITRFLQWIRSAHFLL